MFRRAGMIPLNLANPLASRQVESLLDTDPTGLLALPHASRQRLPGLWGNDPFSPRSVLLLREGDGQIEAFGAGDPRPAVGWLAGLSSPIALLAPPQWRTEITAIVGEYDVGTVVTRSYAPLEYAPPRPPTLVARRLTLQDAAAFTATAPSWALRGWRTFDTLVTQGAAFGIPHGDGFAALAWIFEATSRSDALAVYTVPRYRLLGLGRAASFALLDHVRHVRGKAPLWSASADNEASNALAESLGLFPRVTETILRWPPRSKTRKQPVGIAEEGERSEPS